MGDVDLARGVCSLEFFAVFRRQFLNERPLPLHCAGVYVLEFSAYLGPFLIDLFKHRRYRPRLLVPSITIILARVSAFSLLSAILLLFAA